MRRRLIGDLDETATVGGEPQDNLRIDTVTKRAMLDETATCDGGPQGNDACLMRQSLVMAFPMEVILEVTATWDGGSRGNNARCDCHCRWRSSG